MLFLTTNRTGAFDEAFRSRIHTALYYDILGRDETEAIWRTNLARLLRHKERNRQKIIVADNGEEIIKYAKVHYDALRHQQRAPWNGRQIRNSFQTAVALAEYQARESGSDVPFLRWEHFRDVVLAADHFERYLVDTRGNTEQELADWEGMRANYQRQDSMYGYSKTQARRPQKMSMNESLQMMKTLRPDTWVSPAPPPQDNMFFNPNQRTEAPAGSHAQGALSTPQRGLATISHGLNVGGVANSSMGQLAGGFGLPSSPSPTPLHAQLAPQQQPSPMSGFSGYGQPAYGGPGGLPQSYAATQQQPMQQQSMQQQPMQQQSYSPFAGFHQQQQQPQQLQHQQQQSQQLQHQQQLPGAPQHTPTNSTLAQPSYQASSAYGANAFGGGQGYGLPASAQLPVPTSHNPGADGSGS